MKGLATVLLALLAGVSPLLADAELVLEDGRRLQGVDLRRNGDQYLLELASGEVLTLPAGLVREVLLSGDDTRPPTGLRRTDAETLAGEPIEPPRPSEQLEVLGEAARFQKSPVRSRWTPRPAWDASRDVLEASRSTWQASVVESSWTPTSAFDAGDDVLGASRSQWRDSIVDSTWRPTDGFRSREPEN